jgi:hypothetical protein
MSAASRDNPDAAIVADPAIWYTARQRAQELLLRRNDIVKILPVEFNGITINVEPEGCEKYFESEEAKARWSRWTQFRRLSGLSAVFDELDGLWDYEIDPAEKRLQEAVPSTLIGAIAIARAFATDAYWGAVEADDEDEALAAVGLKAAVAAIEIAIEIIGVAAGAPFPSAAQAVAKAGGKAA